MTEKLRVILDTNIFVASIWRGGKSKKIIHSWKSGRIQLVISPAVLREYRFILGKFRSKKDKMAGILGDLSDSSITLLVKPSRRVNLVKDDPDDNKFLECAEAGNADYIVTSDRHLLHLWQHGKCKIITSGELVRLLQ